MTDTQTGAHTIPDEDVQPVETIPVPAEVLELLQPLADAYARHARLVALSNDAADDVHRLQRALAAARDAAVFYSRLATAEETGIGHRLAMLDAGVLACGLPGRPPLPAARDVGDPPQPPPYVDPLSDPISVDTD